MNLSCGAAGQVSLGEAEGPKTRRVPGGGKGGPSAASTGVVGLLERREGGEGASDGRRAVLIPRESGGGPVRAPCPMRGPLNPGGSTPRRRLFYIILVHKVCPCTS